MQLLLRRAGGTEHVLLALLAAPSIFAVVLSTNAAHSFVALARSCSCAHIIILTVLFRVLLPSLVADHRRQHQAVAAAATAAERLVAAIPLRLQQLLLQLAHVLLLLQPALAATLAASAAAVSARAAYLQADVALPAATEYTRA